jgi:hypothetical protein
MNLAQILETLPPRVYLRAGELVIHFSTPGVLVARIAETQAALLESNPRRVVPGWWRRVRNGLMGEPPSRCGRPPS